MLCVFCFFFSSRRRHTRLQGDWSSDVCSSDLITSTIIHLKHLSAALLKFLSRSAPMKPDGLIMLSTFEYAAGDRSPAAYCFSRLSPFALEPETICGHTAGSLLP